MLALKNSGKFNKIGDIISICTYYLCWCLKSGMRALEDFGADDSGKSVFFRIQRRGYREGVSNYLIKIGVGR